MSSSSHRYLRLGGIFQFTAVITFLFRRFIYWPQLHSLTAALIVGVTTLIGIGIFIWCLHILYIRPKAQNTLITGGIFKYTRHPMYTGLALMDVASWFSPVTAALIFSTVIFYSCLIAAAYLQEKETLARFGKAAHEYYQRTPRLFLWYPFRRLFSH